MLVVVILVWTKDCFPPVEGSNRMPREAEVGVSRGGCDLGRSMFVAVQMGDTGGLFCIKHGKDIKVG